MQILSAVNAVSPAWERTKLFLYTPFRKGRTWKLSATAYLSAAGSAVMPMGLFLIALAPFLGMKFGKTLEYGWIGICLLLSALQIYIFILCGRVQFAFFDMVLNRGEFVKPAWEKYGPQSWKLTSAKLAIAAGVTLLAAFPVVATVHYFIANLSAIDFQNSSPESLHQPLMNAFAAIQLGYLFFCLIVSVYSLTLAIASGFIIPTMALENASVGQAIQRFKGFVRRETGEFFAYIGVRLGIGIVSNFVISFGFQMVFMVLMLVFIVLAGIAGLLLHLLGVSGQILLVLGIVSFAVYAFVVGGYVMIFGLGAFFTFFQAHTLYFLGGRYPLLGELLEKSTPPPPPPTYWPPNLVQAAYPPSAYPPPSPYDPR